MNCEIRSGQCTNMIVRTEMRNGKEVRACPSCLKAIDAESTSVTYLGRYSSVGLAHEVLGFVSIGRKL